MYKDGEEVQEDEKDEGKGGQEKASKKEMRRGPEGLMMRVGRMRRVRIERMRRRIRVR